MVLGVPPRGPQAMRGGASKPRRLFAAAALLLCLQGGVALAQEVPREAHGWRHAPHRGGYMVKASHLVKFPAFVAWPDSAFETPSSPFRLCIGGVDPFGPLIDRFAHNARVGDHEMTVTRLPSVAKGADCHVLFVSPSRGQTPREMIAAVTGRPVLTVADEGIDAPGAMIQFVTLESRVRFEIRGEAAQTEGLVVSSKLLSLSVTRGIGER
ncbi:YfiR family protein [uncultured Caulobacter sp.]|uniref:YfiR family protein n=1 Tax=uncultured Caulobacter sp. TaxID=158749 RepID=UPI00261887B8|nr:YfiR family protein [uncultured Caulobacter sp.]